MSLYEEMKDNFGIDSIKNYDKKFSELKEQFIEMAQLKSSFDIEKFTIRKEGKFIAHNFHFLMRQYSLALSEAKRILLDKEEKVRKLKELNDLYNSSIKKGFSENEITCISETDNTKTTYVDIEIKRIMNDIDMIELTLTNKIAMCNDFEKCRKKLIEMNVGIVPTNEQYQSEEPEYWRWFLQNQAINEHQARISGISEGTWNSIRQLEEDSVLNDNFKVKITDDYGMFNLDEAKSILNKLIGKETKQLQ